MKIRQHAEHREPSCEKEEQILAALVAGAPDAAVLDHARDCAVCSEVLLVAAHLREEAALGNREIDSLPDPSRIWRKAQARTREKSLAKSAMPIRMMRICSAVFAIVALPWIVVQLLHSPVRISDFSFGHSLATESSWLTVFTGTTLFGISLTFACILAGSWYMLREK